MKRFDRYVMSYFVSSFAIAFLFIIGLFLMIDVMGKVDEFFQAAHDLPPELRSSVPSYVFRYYALSIPYYFLQFAPFITLLAVLFTGVRLVQNNELVPMVNSGVSVFRLVSPLFGAALFVALSMLVVREKLIPWIDPLRDSLKDRLLNQRIEPIYNNFWLVVDKKFSVRCEHFMPASNRVEDLLVIPKSKVKDSIILSARTATYQDGPEGIGWYLEGGRKVIRSGEGEGRSEEIHFLRGFAFTPHDLYVAFKGQDNPIDLSFGQLNQLSLRAPERRDYLTLLHYFLTFPLMNLILPLIGLPFVLRFEKRAASEGIAYAFLIFFAYFGVDLYLRNIGNQGGLHPLIASWLGVVFFGSLGIILFHSSRT